MSNSPLTLIAVGDLAFNGRYHRLLERHGPEYPFQHVAQHWRDADLRIGNLESPITTAPRVASDKLTLRGTPRALESLRWAGFDCLSLANNHMMDFGAAGLIETCERLSDAGIAHVGAGRNLDEATSPAIVERKGQKIGILAFCDVEQISPLYAGAASPGVARRPRSLPERGSCAPQSRGSGDRSDALGSRNVAIAFTQSAGVG